jgi:hypothetical protein
MKQTAVEWLIQELNQKIDFISMDKWDMIIDIMQQAKEMEKEQIIDAFQAGDDRVMAEQYYNETFKQDQ